MTDNIKYDIIYCQIDSVLFGSQTATKERRMKHRANGPEQKSRSRQRQTANPRMTCAFTKRLLATSERKIVIDDVGVEIVVSETAFFRDFVYPVTVTDRTGKADKKKAAGLVPGLVKYKGSRRICWKFNFRQFARKASVAMLTCLLERIPEDSPLRLRICGADERARFANAC